MPISVTGYSPGTSIPGAGVSFMHPGNNLGGSNETINYTGALTGGPTGFTIFNGNNTKSATNASSQPAGPNKTGWIAAVAGTSTSGGTAQGVGSYGTRVRLPVTSFATGSWTVVLDCTSTGLLGPTVAIGAKIWQVSADLTTATVIKDWFYGANFTAAQTAYTFNSGSVTGATLSSSTPYLYIELCLNVVTGGTNVTANAIVVTNVHLNPIPALAYSRDPSTYTTETVITDSSSNHFDGMMFGVDGPAGIPTIVTGDAGFGNAVRFVGGNNVYNNKIYAGTNPAFDLTTPFTVEMRIKLTASAAGVCFAARWDANTGSTTHWKIGTTTGPVFLATITNSSLTQINATDTVNLTINTTYSIALDWDGTTLRLYRDGAVVGSAPVSSVNPYTSDNTPLTIGGFSSSTITNEFSACPSADIDEFRLSNISRYGGASYTPATGPFVSDANTVVLYHFESTSTVNVSQTSTPTDAVTRATAVNRTISETNSAATDAVTRQYNALRTVSETLSAATDTITRNTSTFRTISETVPAATDAVTRATTVSRTISETVPAATDAVTRVYNAIRTVSETIAAATDAISRVFSANRTISETVPAATDSVTRATAAHRTISETVPAATDSVTRQFSATRVINEAVATGTTVVKKILYMFDD